MYHPIIISIHQKISGIRWDKFSKFMGYHRLMGHPIPINTSIWNHVFLSHPWGRTQCSIMYITSYSHFQVLKISLIRLFWKRTATGYVIIYEMIDTWNHFLLNLGIRMKYGFTKFSKENDARKTKLLTMLHTHTRFNIYQSLL